MPAMHETLVEHRDEVLQRWKRQVQGSIAPESMPAAELIDHLPVFLDEVIAALRAHAGLPTKTSSPEHTPTAAGHGTQRLRLGFSLDAVVREYGAMRDAIVATTRDAGCDITFAELHILFASTISGIAHAVSEYTWQRDAELARQHNEHIAFIAHELRNPLATATSAVELLEMKGMLPATERAAAALGRGLAKMRELIDHSLHAARAASGIELKRESARLSEIIEDAQVASQIDADAKNVKIESAIESDATLAVDVRLMRSALTNLVRNAVKFTDAGGHIDVRGRITNARAIVEVEDGCGGLADGAVEKMFAPFVRMPSTQPGFGLGLAIAKQAMDAHGGTIRVQNVPGKGCIFVLELPLT